MKWLVSAAAGALFVLSLCLCLWTSVSASDNTDIECYDCNSFTDPDGCSYARVDKKYLKNCTEWKRGSKANQCRTIRQWIDFDLLGMKANERVIRACGSEGFDSTRDCYYRAGFGGRQEVCRCKKSGCNHAPGLATSQPMVMLLALVTAILSVQRMVV